MPVESVTIAVRRDTFASEPVPAAVVQVYDDTGTVFIAEGTSDIAGNLLLQLEGEDPATRYQLRLFARGSRFRNPIYIEVLSPPEPAPNEFLIPVPYPTPSEAADPLLCRASGLVRGIDGRPFRGCEVTFLPCFNPFVAGTDTVLSERVVTRSDAAGYISVDLYRNAKYQVIYETREDTMREVTVPDRASVEFSHLLFPIPVTVTFDPPGPYAIEVDEELEVTVTTTATNHRELPCGGFSDVSFTSSDNDVFTIAQGNGTLTLTGVGAGSAELVGARADRSIVYVPALPLYGVPVGVDVTT